MGVAVWEVERRVGGGMVVFMLEKDDLRELADSSLSTLGMEELDEDEDDDEAIVELEGRAKVEMVGMVNMGFGTTLMVGLTKFVIGLCMKLIVLVGNLMSLAL